MELSWASIPTWNSINLDCNEIEWKLQFVLNHREIFLGAVPISQGALCTVGALICWRVGIGFGESLESDLSPLLQADGGEQAAAFGRCSTAEAASKFHAGSSKSLPYHKDSQIVLTLCGGCCFTDDVQYLEPRGSGSFSWCPRKWWVFLCLLEQLCLTLLPAVHILMVMLGSVACLLRTVLEWHFQTLFLSHLSS